MKSTNTDRIIGLSAMLISLVTLVMFIYQTNIMHKQSRLSIRPRLSFTTSYNFIDGKLEYSSILKNKGIGPAIVQKAIIDYKGKEHPMAPDIFFEETFPKLGDWGDFKILSSIDEGSTLSAGESTTLFTYEFEEKDLDKIAKYLKVADEDELPFNIIIEYVSMYGEKWVIDSDNNQHPTPLN